MAQILRNDPSGVEALYKKFLRGLRYYLYRQLGPEDAEDSIHEVFLMATRAIQRGDIKEPERLAGFIRTIAQRQVAAVIQVRVKARAKEACLEDGVQIKTTALNPEQQLLVNERMEIARKALERMSEKDREILTRFYLHEQPSEQICREMNLTETQFRLSKSRAKAKFGQFGQKETKPGSHSAVVGG